MLKRPANLDKEAAAFWNAHARRCQDNGSLTPATLHSFILLCRTWSAVATLDPAELVGGHNKFAKLEQRFNAQAVPFGLSRKTATAPEKATVAGVLEKLFDHTDQENDEDAPTTPESHSQDSQADRRPDHGTA